MNNKAEDTCREMRNVLTSVKQLLTWQTQLVDHGIKVLDDLLGPPADSTEREGGPSS